MPYPSTRMPGPSAPLRILALLFLLATVTPACHRPDPAKSIEYQHKAESYLSKGNYDKARVELRNALKENPNNIEARVLLGDTYLQLGAIGDAYAAYQGAFQLAPSNLRAGLRAGLIEVDAARFEKARKTAAQLEKSVPGNAATLLIRARLAEVAKNHEKSLALSRAAWKKQPDWPEAAEIYASNLFHDGQLARAVQLAKSAWLKAPNEPAIRNFYIKLLIRVEYWQDAEQALRKAIATTPRDFQLRRLLAMVLLKSNREREAEAFLRASLKETDNDPRMIALFSDFIVERKGWKEALDALLRLAKKSSDPIPFELRRGEILEQTGRWGEAKTIYAKLLQRKGRGNWREKARKALARIHLVQGNLNEAAKYAEAVLKDSPRDPDALLVRAVISLRDRRGLDAIPDLRSVLKARPKSRKVRRWLAEAHLMNGEPDLARQNLLELLELYPDDTDALLMLARLDVKAGKPDRAIARLRKSWNPKIADERLSVYLVRLLLQYHKDKEALELARQIQAHQPGSALGYLLAGLVHQKAGKEGAALAALKEAVAADPKSEIAFSLLVTDLIAQRQYDQAEQKVQEAIRQHPQNALWYALLAQVLEARSDLDGAEQALHKAAERKKDWAGVWFQIAQIQAKKGRWKQAIASQKRGLAVDPDNYPMQVELAVLQDRAGDTASARAFYEKVLKSRPKDIVAANNLAMILVRQAKRNAERLRTLLPLLEGVDHPEILDSRAWILLNLGNAQRAIPLLKKALEKAPDDGGFHYHMARARLALGDALAARKHLAVAVEHKEDLDPPERHDAIRLLRAEDRKQAP